MADRKWVDVGAASDLRDHPVRRVEVEGVALALSWADGIFAAVDATCAHKGGPLDQGTLADGCLVCPWHS